ncbi:MAG: Mandelate racemase/muconate lactonizing enzyme-like protein [Ramlibacter sp.]|nr:Mandelate racemase/muconate lactonizing enzyme-like protein [Ramlibacter sp.]
MPAFIGLVRTAFLMSTVFPNDGEAMKSVITDITVEVVRWDHPAYSFSHNATYTAHGKSELAVIRVTTSEGIEGNAFWGTFHRDNTGTATLVKAVLPGIKAALIGADPFQREQLWARFAGMARYNELSWRWLNAIDVALWDIAGKAAGLPVYQLLGGYRDKILAYASGADYDDAGAYIEEALKYKSQGLRAYKIHGGSRGPLAMIALCEKVRNAVGSDMDLMLDTGTDPCTLAAALEIGRALERLRFRWYEEPMPWWQIDNYAELSSRLDIPVALHDSAEPRVFPLLTYIKAKAGSIIRSDAPRDGITGLKKLASICEAHGLNIEIHHGGNSLGNVANLHVIMAIPNTHFYEHVVPEAWHQFGLKVDIKVDREGYVHAPDKPGLGYEIDWEKLRSLDAQVVT